jgi:hypothetical protein
MDGTDDQTIGATDLYDPGAGCWNTFGGIQHGTQLFGALQLLEQIFLPRAYLPRSRPGRFGLSV